MFLIRWLAALFSFDSPTVCRHDWQYVQPPTGLRPLGGIVECKKCGKVDMQITP